MSLHIYCKLSLHACTCVLSRVRLLATPWTVVFQTPLSLEFSRQQSWSGLPFPPPGDLPKPRIKPVSPVLASRFFTAGTTWDAWKWALLGILSRCSSPGHFLRAGVFYSSVGLLNTKRPEGRNWPQEAAFRNAPPGYLGNQRLGKVVLLGCGSQPKGPRWTPKDLRLITWILIVFWSILEYIVGLITFRYICVNAGDIIAFIFYASVTQLCPTLCHPVDCSPPGSSVRGILQARILEWVAFPPPGEVILHLIHVPYLFIHSFIDGHCFFLLLGRIVFLFSPFIIWNLPTFASPENRDLLQVANPT